MTRTLWLVPILLQAFAVAGCNTIQPSSPDTDARVSSGNIPGSNPGTTQPATTGATDRTLPDGSIRHDTDSARIAQLWAAAEKARTADDYETADLYLRDALSIAPGDGVLWSRAAEIKLKLLELALAENYAAKSNVYAVSNRTLQHRNWLIIEHARGLRGDLLGVREARKMVQQLQKLQQPQQLQQ